VNWYVDVLKKYVLFEGRAHRTEFWMFFLFNLVIGVVLAILDAILGTTAGSFGLLGSVYSLAVLLPSLGVGARRLHDTNRSGWLLLIGLIPIVGVIIVLVLLIPRGTEGANQYGPDPLAAA
jgi:uncharacterized membrane protein YhaH (DUF805 family)